MNKNDINRFRILLDRYYAGDTTSEQEQELMKMAKSFDLDNMPTDIVDDVRMLCDMSTLSGDARQFADFLDALPPNVDIKPSRRRFNRTIWISAAASVALLLTVGGFALFNNDSHESTKMIAKTERVANVKVQTNEITSIKDVKDDELLKVDNDKSELIASTKPKKTTRQTKSVKEQISVTDEESNYIEVTDPEEAARIFRQSLNLISQNMSVAESSIDVAERSLQTTSKTIKRIL